MKFKRSAGILLPITSLYSNQGIGTMGKAAYDFVDFLKQSKIKMWQIFPIGPTGFGDSPYQTFSAFAGNPLWIDFEDLVKKRLLTKTECKVLFELPENFVDYGQIVPLKHQLLLKAFERFSKKKHLKFENFCNKNAYWLDEYALFMALKHHHNGKSWNEWGNELKNISPHLLVQLTTKYHSEIMLHKFVQYTFFRQWFELKNYANANNIQIIGDIPIFVAFDSADAWANPELFLFDENHNPIKVAGVPPDAFTADGQLWGNPLYNWETIEQSGFKWWISRIRFATGICDIIRIDHFRGFESAWYVDYGEKTARNGQWVKAPGKKLFEAVKKSLGKLPIIAEDLGFITDEVIKLRDDFAFPGMKILQFAFYGGDDNPYLPKNVFENSVMYTGTHDNQTTLGWFNTLEEHTKHKVNEYFGYPTDIVDSMINKAWKSKSCIAIAPLQDFLKLDDSARMNTPGSSSGNWVWRFKKDMLTRELSEYIRKITTEASR